MNQPIAIAFGVPVMIVFVAAIGRKLARKTAWELRDFCLGVHLCLATFSANLLFIFELLRSKTPVDPNQTITALLSLVVVFAIYIWLLALYQDWDNDEADLQGRIIRLVIISNLAGIGLFAAFVFQVKGIR